MFTKRIVSSMALFTCLVSVSPAFALFGNANDGCLGPCIGPIGIPNPFTTEHNFNVPILYPWPGVWPVPPLPSSPSEVWEQAQCMATGNVQADLLCLYWQAYGIR